MRQQNNAGRFPRTAGIAFLAAWLVAGAAGALDLTDIFIVGHDAVTSLNPTLIRADRDGNILWQKPLPLVKWGGDHGYYGDRNLTEDALYVASWQSEDLVGGKHRLLKLDADGDVVWDVALSEAKFVISANPVHGGAYALETGATGDLFKLDTGGNVVWVLTDPDLLNPRFVSTDVTTGGVYVSAADSKTVLKVDPGGNVIWRKAFAQFTGRVAANPIDGGVYVGCDHYNRITYRLDGDGNIIWQKSNFPSPWTYGRAASPIDGSLYIGSGWPGRLTRVAIDGTVAFNISRPNYNENLTAASEDLSVYIGDYAERGVMKYADDGSLLWQKTYGPPSWIGSYGIVGVYTGTPSALATTGGTALGQTVTSLLCYNQTQRRSASPAAASPWDCEAAGLPVAAGDQIVTYVYGTADGEPPAGGSLTGMASVDYLRCTNLSSGQRVYPALASPWDCEAAGLVVGTGDRLRMTVIGTLN